MGSISSPAQSSALFKPLHLGRLNLSHRLVLAPLTRLRNTDQHVPLPFVADYYAQRAVITGTLLLSEATCIAPRATGMGNVPGIWSQAQIDSWKMVTDAVHEKGSYIYCQLWAFGRAASAEELEKEEGGPYDVVSASNRPIANKPDVPRPLTSDEVEEYIRDFAQAARNAIAAGFDGVEIHGANGYLLDQFLQDVSNDRTDAWGGSIEKRARFHIEVARACADAIGSDRVGMRLSPWSDFQSMKMSDPKPTFSYLTAELAKLGLAYVHAVEARVMGSMDQENHDKTEDLHFLVDAWKNAGAKERPVLLAGGFKPEIAFDTVDNQHKDENVAIVFGRYWISNPDLVFKIKNKLPLTKYDRQTFYKAKSRDGYTDYDFSEEFKSAGLKL